MLLLCLVLAGKVRANQKVVQSPWLPWRWSILRSFLVHEISMVSRNWKWLSVLGFRQIENWAIYKKHLGTLIKANELARNKNKNLPGNNHLSSRLRKLISWERVYICVCGLSWFVWHLIMAFLEYFLCARNLMLTPPYGVGTLLSLFCRCRNCSLERRNDLPKVTPN